MKLLTQHFFADLNVKVGGFFEVSVGHRLHITLWTLSYWHLAAQSRQVCIGPLDIAWWDE